MAVTLTAVGSCLSGALTVKKRTSRRASQSPVAILAHKAVLFALSFKMGLVSRLGMTQRPTIAPVMKPPRCPRISAFGSIIVSTNGANTANSR